MRSIRFRSKTEIASHLSQQRQSGLTVAEYCNQHSIPVSTFFNWQKRNGIKSRKPPSFARLTLSAPETLHYEVQGKDITIRVPLSAEESVLQRVISILREVY